VVVHAVDVGASWAGVLGTLGGLVAGLLAPVVGQRSASRVLRRERQADLGRAALVLFEGDETLDVLLRGTASATRRKLFLLATQLDDDAARRASLDLVASAGDPSVPGEVVEERWTTCVRALGRVARSG
jgi:hypothetical protein